MPDGGTALHWAKQGPKGDTGEKGAKGDPGVANVFLGTGTEVSGPRVADAQIVAGTVDIPSGSTVQVSFTGGAIFGATPHCVVTSHEGPGGGGQHSYVPPGAYDCRPPTWCSG